MTTDKTLKTLIKVYKEYLACLDDTSDGCWVDDLTMSSKATVRGVLDTPPRELARKIAETPEFNELVVQNLADFIEYIQEFWEDNDDEDEDED